MFARVTLAVCVGAANACGGVAVSNDAPLSRGGDAATNGGSGGGGGRGGRGGSAGESLASGGACAAPAPLEPTSGPPPNHVGCYAGIANGWLEVPCLCELPATNTTATSKSAWLRFTVTPDTPTPSLVGLPDIEISVEDADASWYRVWASQPDVGQFYIVTNTDSRTTVRLGTTNLALYPVPLAACETRKASATMSGAGPTANLALEVNVADNRTGANFVTTDSSCQELIHP